MNIEEKRTELTEKMNALVSAAETETRSMSDEEVTQYEALDKELQAVNKTAEIRAKQDAYNAPTVLAAKYQAKGDEVLERAFEAYLKTGIPNADLVELRAQGSSDAAGGYTVPQGFRQKLVEVQKAFGGIRSVAEVITTDTGAALEYPTNDDTAHAGAITAESAAITSGDDLTFGTVTLGAYKYTATGAGSNLPLRVPVELLQDSAFDIAGYVSKKLGERIARKQATDFAVGTGSTQPTGLMHTTFDENNGGTTITYAKLNAMRHDVDPYYRNGAVWVMNDASLEEIEGLVDSTGRPLIAPSANAGLQGAPSNGTLLGSPVIVDNSVVVASGNAIIAYGNIREAYVIRDVKDVTVVVNPYSRASNGEVEYLAWARADGTIQNRAAYATIKDSRP